MEDGGVGRDVVVRGCRGKKKGQEGRRRRGLFVSTTDSQSISKTVNQSASQPVSNSISRTVRQLIITQSVD